MIELQRDVVKFEKGAILRKEMLESIYNYPRILNESYYSHYSDGILYGLEWYEVNGKHCISPGALKYKGEIYFQTDTIVLEDEISIDELKTSQEYYIYFKELPAESSYSRKVFNLGLNFTTEPISNGFCYKYIKYELNKIKSLDSKKICGLYASFEPNSFCIPVNIIEKEILPVISKKITKHPLDFEVLISIYKHNPLPVEIVELYISEYNSSISDLSDKIEIDLSRENVRMLVDNLVKAVDLLVPPAFCLAEKKEMNSTNITYRRNDGCML